MDFLYQEILMDHYRNPRNQGSLKVYTFMSAHHNPSCGDKVQLQGQVIEGRIEKLVFEGSGCVISLATASLLTEAVINKSLTEIQQLDGDFIKNLIGIQLGLTRLKCALLPLIALQEGLEASNQQHTATLKEHSNAGSGQISPRIRTSE